MKRVLITACDYPDLDGVACAYAYADYLRNQEPDKEYVVKFGKGLIIEPKYVLEQLGITPEFIDDAEIFDEYILVDACENKGLPSIVELGSVIDVIDHRMYPDYKSFPNSRFRIEPVGAAATQIAEYFFFDQLVDLSPENAALLLCAIYSNTVNLKSDTTTFRDIRMTEWLFTKVEQKNLDLHKRMYAYKTDYFLNHLESSLRDDMHDDCSQFGEGIIGVMYQAEVGDGSVLLSRSSELFDLFRKIYPDRPYQMLIIQDAGAGKTSILSEFKPVLDALCETNLRGKLINGTTYQISQITMRKSIKKALYDRLNGMR